MELWSKEERIRQIKIDETIHVYEDDNLKVVIPKTQESALLYGKGTTWCFCSDKEYELYKDGKITETTFHDYTEDDVIYIFIMKNKKLVSGENRKYCMRFETGEFHDEKGAKHDFAIFLKDYPKLKETLEAHVNSGTYIKYRYPFLHLDYMNEKLIKINSDPFAGTLEGFEI